MSFVSCNTLVRILYKFFQRTFRNALFTDVTTILLFISTVLQLNKVYTKIYCSRLLAVVHRFYFCEHESAVVYPIIWIYLNYLAECSLADQSVATEFKEGIGKGKGFTDFYRCFILFTFSGLLKELKKWVHGGISHVVTGSTTVKL